MEEKRDEQKNVSGIREKTALTCSRKLRRRGWNHTEIAMFRCIIRQRLLLTTTKIALLTASDRTGTDYRLGRKRSTRVASGKLAQQIENNRRILSSGTALRGFQRLNYPE